MASRGKPRRGGASDSTPVFPRESVLASPDHTDSILPPRPVGATGGAQHSSGHRCSAGPKGCAPWCPYDKPYKPLR